MNTSANIKYKILVVDDDLDVNNTLALMLEYDGHKVQTASTGEAAWAMLIKTSFDLIIMEYWLPQMKGDELAALIKQQWPDQPIIMVTANIGELNADDHPITGVDCLLSKSFSLLQLREAMIWIFDRYAERRQSGLGTHGVSGGHPEKPDYTRSAPRDSSDL